MEDRKCQSFRAVSRAKGSREDLGSSCLIFVRKKCIFRLCHSKEIREVRALLV